jgi:hypothetical protein
MMYSVLLSEIVLFREKLNISIKQVNGANMEDKTLIFFFSNTQKIYVSLY